ncbi:MAG: response regulator [Flavobacteriales bacterium]|nr:response regulator [Flavobacteriales bacterium]
MAKILTIEDDVLLRETLTEILEVYGYNVFQAENGEEGLEMFSKTKPDLVLCDINMPKMDGLEVLKKLKVSFGEADMPPFIFLSAKTEKKNIQQALDLGAVDFVSKPYSAPELLNLIQLRLNE